AAALCFVLHCAWETGTLITTLSGAIRAGLRCRCPRCGKGKLFAGFLTLRPRCEVCGLDYGFADAGDGPAVFIMFLAGFIVVGSALIVEVFYHPPYWVHAVLWLPLILIVTLGPLRPMKGLMIALQHYHKAEERRFGGGAPWACPAGSGDRGLVCSSPACSRLSCSSGSAPGRPRHLQRHVR